MQPFRDHDDLPRSFGDYTLIKPLGRGGMGEVFLAQLKGRGLAGVDKVCVIKTLRPTNDPEYERRFIDEARLIVLLGHKNICPVFDAGCFEGEYYLAMEHVAGRELRSLQRASEARGSPMPAGVVIHIVKEVLEGLDAAHRMTHPLTREALRVVHRDVSPQNVMVSSEGEVKLIDFGLAVSTQKVERTAPQIVMGKMAYMAPEQARGDVVDGRVDQFACGVMLYELLSNERYYGEMPFEQMWRMSGAGGHRPRLLETLPADVREVILKATAASREDRYASCGDMRDALTAIELRRGTIAGSRDVRGAQEELDAVSMPSLAAPMPPPTMSFDDLGAAPKERTRTFRLITAEGAGPAVIEGLEPGAVTASARASSPSPVTTSLKQPTPTVFGAAATVEIKPVEQTIITRPSAPLPTPPPLTGPSMPPSSSSVRRSLAILAIGAAVLLVAGGAAVTVLRQPAADVVVDAGAATVAAVVDAGAAVVEPVDAGAFVDAGVAVAFVDAGAVAAAPIDAGSNDAATPIDAGSTDAGAVETPKPKKPTTTTEPRKPKPKGRDLPPLPPRGTAPLFRTSVLGTNCSDLRCNAAVQLRLRGAKTPAAVEELEAAIGACYAECSRTPLPEK